MAIVICNRRYLAMEEDVPIGIHHWIFLYSGHSRVFQVGILSVE